MSREGEGGGCGDVGGIGRDAVGVGEGETGVVGENALREGVT